MNLNVIKIYINKLKKESLKDFLNNNEIIVNEEELDYLYNIIKYDFEKLLEEDSITINNIKNNINSNAYNKLINLFNKYKKIYLK